jgi:hypothetical protein
MEESLKLYIVVRIDNDYQADILAMHNTYDAAISFLTTHIDEDYEVSLSNKYTVKQKSNKHYDVYVNGFFGKYFQAKYQILQVDRN